MSVDYRDDRKKWGYRFSLHGKPFKRYVWNTKTEAREAERLAIIEAKKSPQLQPTALVTASGAYLIESAKRGRSQWRIDGLHYTFNAHIVPHFGEATLRKPGARRFTVAAESLSGYNEGPQSRSICGNTPRLRANRPLRFAEKKILEAGFT